MSLQILLPTSAKAEEIYRLAGTPVVRPSSPPKFNRVAYAAAHVVRDPKRGVSGQGAVDWDTTLAFRHHLWSLGFKIAEAMDTSQRGMGLDWAGASELIERSIRDSKSVEGADIASGAGTDHMQVTDSTTLLDIISAYETQLGFVEKCGGRAIMMASRALAKVAKTRDDYVFVYSKILSQAKDKVILHWLGDMFDAQLAGYWGSSNFDEALDTVVEIIAANSSKVEGIKISLLEHSKEIALRNRLPDGILCYTGDDFNYAELIEGDGLKHSHALLGIFDAVAPQASLALTALSNNNIEQFRSIIAPTVPLSRKIFETPTQYYKAGVVFLAYLNGHQSHFSMLDDMQTARNAVHYAEIFKLADQANVLDNPELAVQRMKLLQAV